ncbi:hypothetical protein MIZ03_2588 [Rhodoferax lithotrophicus]|uniref:Transmembrane anti-sigma factor n=1 Tax=Rhodoferax lithotrophicus TaxID=2798804 RepID=A0ABN6D6N7_9BURK|nr:anti-sigma factor [Rhodoferax sp. MIZ03]BCO27699.1 hypothetical protein MIZ03_2588 [Rhodoferax sp. MIZ03]
MAHHTRPSLTDDDLHILVDGQDTPAQLAALQEKLTDDPAGRVRLAQWQKQRHALHDLHSKMQDEVPPHALIQLAQRAQRARQTTQHIRHYGSMAAGVVMAFAAGWLANSRWQTSDMQNLSAPTVARAQFEQNFVHQASLAHRVFVPEVRHPVEVSAQEQAHLLQWLSKRLGKTLKVPDLTTQGFELMGGRLLPGDTGTRAQFMFQNTRGQRITLYLGALNQVVEPNLPRQETAFRYEPQAGVPSFYWMDQGFGYALAGELPRAELMKLANNVYRQLL